MARILKNKDEFKKEVLEANAPVLVDFFAQWCGPCKMLAPVLDEISQEMGDKALVFKVDVDEAGDIATDYNIKLLPTMIFFKDGKEMDKIVGMGEKEDIISKINNLI